MIKIKTLVSKVFASILTISLIFSNCPVTVSATTDVDISITTNPKVDVILATGRLDKSGINVANFDTDLKNAMRNLGVDVDKVLNISKIETSSVSMSNNFTWNTAYMDYNTNGASVPGTGIGNITISNNGANIDMIGNASLLGKNAIFTMPATDSQQVFQYNYSIDFGDSFNAAGMLLRVKEENNVLSGYMLSFNNGNWVNVSKSNGAIWKFSFPKGSNRSNMTKTLVKPLTINKSGTLTIKSDSKYIEVSGGGLPSEVLVNVDSGYGYGFGFFADHYGHGCSSIGKFNLSGIALKETNAQHFSDVLKVPKWRDGAIRVLANINDYAEEDFENSTKLGEILSRTLNEDISYVAWGPSSTQAANNTFIAQNSNKGKYIQVENSSNYQAAIDATAQYIKSLFPSASATSETVLKDAPLNINVAPNSLKHNTATAVYPSGRWYIAHTPTSYEYPIGQYEHSNTFRQNLDFESLNKTGRYEIKFEDKLIKTINVHRKPDVGFSLRNSANNISLESQSSDLDQYSRNTGYGPGIAAEEWQYKQSSATSWINGKLTYAQPGVTYVIKLRVKDFQGQWSDPVTKYVAGDAAYVVPVADFSFDKTAISKYGSVVVRDSSYDPKSLPLNSYRWEVSNGNTSLYDSTEYSFFTPPINFVSSGVGTYSYKLTVKNTANLTSEAYTRFLTVVDDTSAPEIEVNPTNCNWQNGINVNLKFTDSDSKLSRYRYAFTTSASPPSSSDSSWTGYAGIANSVANAVVSPTIEGKLYLHVQTFDTAGNNSVISRGVYNIDNSKPVINSHTFNGASGGLSTNKSVSVKVNGSDAYSGVKYIEYKLTGQASYTTQSNGDFDFNVTNPYSGPISIYMYDNIGNKSSEYVIYNLIIESTPPTLNVPDNANWLTSNAVLNVTANDSNGIRSITYTTNESPPQTGSISSGQNIVLTNEGQYSLTVIATDNSGNSTTVKRNLKIDKSKPSFGGHRFNNVNGSLVTNRDVTVKSIVSDDFSGTKNIEYRLSGETAYTELDDNDFAFEVEAPYSGPISVYLYDKVGWKSAEYIINDLIIETIPPVLTAPTTPNWYSSDAILKIEATDANGIRSITYRTNESTPQTGSLVSGGYITLVNEGKYTLTITAIDNAGNSTVITRSINIDKSQPLINSHTFNGQAGDFLFNGDTKVRIFPTDKHSGVNRLEYKLNGSRTYTALPIGKYEFVVSAPYSGPISIYAYDNITNQSEEYIIDNLLLEVTPPSLTVDAALPWYTDDAIINVVASDTNGIKSITYKTNERTPQFGTVDASNQIILANEGEYLLTVIATDKAGNTTTVIRNINIDKTKPIATTHKLTERPTKFRMVTNKIVDVVVTVDEKLSGFSHMEYKLPDSTDYESTTLKSFVMDKTNEGPISVYIYDIAGNKSLEYTIGDLVVEDVSPDLSVEDAPAWSTTPITITATLSDKYGMKLLEYKTNETVPQTGKTDNPEASVDITLVNEGVYDLSVTVTDTATNVTEVTKPIHIDLTAPVINSHSFTKDSTFESQLKTDKTITNDSVLISFETFDKTSGFNHLEYKLHGDNTYSRSETQSFRVERPVEGDISVFAYDIAGNKSSEYLISNLIVEVIPPALELETPPDWSKTEVELLVTSSDINGISHIIYTTNEEVPQTGTATTGNKIVLKNEGIYDVIVTSTDVAGNQTSVSKKLHIDLTVPVIEKVLVNNADSIVSNGDVLVEIFARDDLSGLKSYKYWLNGDKAFRALNSGTSFEIKDVHSNRLRVVAVDVAGNESSSFTVPITIEKTTPTLLVEDIPIWAKDDIIVKTRFKDDNNVGSLTWTTSEKIPQSGFEQLSGKPLGNKVEGFNSHLINVKNEGVYNLKVVLADEAGNTKTVENAIRIDKTKPTMTDVVAISFGTEILDNKAIRFKASGADSLSGVNRYEYKLKNTDWIATEKDIFSVSDEYSGDIAVRVVDNAGNVSDEIKKSFTIDTTAPTFTVSGPTDWVRTTAYYVVTATDEFGIRNVSYETNEKIPQSGEGNLFALNNQGIYNVTIVVTDNAGNTSKKTIPVKIDLTKSLKAPLVHSFGSASGEVTENSIRLKGTTDEAPFSGIRAIQHSYDGGASWTDGDMFEAANNNTDRGIIFRSVSNAGLESANSSPFRVVINKYVTITINPNNGQPTKNLKIPMGTTLPALETFKNGNKTFDGWYLDSELKTLVGESTIFEKDTELFAKWTDVKAPVQAKEYTLKYGASEGGSIKGESKQTVKEGEDGESVTVIADTGYSFVKWSDGETSEKRTDKKIKKNLDIKAIFEKPKVDEPVVVPAVVTPKNESKVVVPEKEKPKTPEVVQATEIEEQATESNEFSQVVAIIDEDEEYSRKLSEHIGLPRTSVKYGSVGGGLEAINNLLSGATEENLDKSSVNIDKYDANKTTSDGIIFFETEGSSWWIWMIVIICGGMIAIYIYKKKKK